VDLAASPESKENAPNYTWRQKKSSLPSSVVDLVNTGSGNNTAADSQDTPETGKSTNKKLNQQQRMLRTAYDPGRLIQVDRQLLLDAGILVQEYR
jgi:hypothetical protein